jgi:hypothetical protein
MSDKHFFAYGRAPRALTVFIEQRGKRFNFVFGRAVPLGLTATRRPIR